MREEWSMTMRMVFVTVSMTLPGFFFGVAVCRVVVVQDGDILGNVFALDFFFDLLVVTAILAPECQRHQPRHIKRSHSGREETHHPKDLAVTIRKVLTRAESTE